MESTGEDFSSEIIFEQALVGEEEGVHQTEHRNFLKN